MARFTRGPSSQPGATRTACWRWRQVGGSHRTTCSTCPPTRTWWRPFSVNHPKVLAAAREIIATADAQSAERFDPSLKQVETELGISFEDEVFQAFGDVWVLHDSPGGGGLLVSAGVLSLKVKDGSKARRVYEQLMKVLERALPGEQAGNFRRRAVHLVEGTFMEQTVHFVNIVDVPFAPAFCLTETHQSASVSAADSIHPNDRFGDWPERDSAP